MADITLRGLTKRYGTVPAVQPLDLSIPDGSFVVLVGPSGCGKTTTLRMLAGLETPTDGEVWIGPDNVTTLDPKDRNVAMVFQNYALYPHLTVAENIGFALAARKRPKKEIESRVLETARMLDIEALLDRKPKALSGGQQQRVAIARATIRQPAVFLFDEPLSNLDAKLRVRTRTELLRLQRSLGATMVYVTHDQEEAMILADILVVMNEGRVVQQGKPQEVFRTPANEFVARFIGSPEINLLDGTVSDGAFVGSGLRITIGGAIDGPVRLGIRPDDIRLVREVPDAYAAGRFEASIDVIETIGSSAILYLDHDGIEIRATVTEGDVDGLGERDRIQMAVDGRRLSLFDPATGDRLG